jgi:glycogen debranching enzyme
MDNKMFSGWGVRTLASSEPRYNPMSYHNGSVWPHDNVLIASGFARYGFARQATRVFEGLFDAAVYIDLLRLPELFCGFSRQRSQGPTLYPVACSPQAWSATAPLALLQTCLGLGFDPQNRNVIFNRPVLPSFLDEVVLRGLSVGEARLDVLLSRVGTEVAVNVLKRTGDVRVMTTS